MERREADELRRELAGLDRRVTRLEENTVKRNGPIVDELRAVSGGLASFKREVASRDELRRELSRQTNELERKREAGKRELFTRREKLAGSALALAVVVLQALALAGVHG